MSIQYLTPLSCLENIVSQSSILSSSVSQQRMTKCPRVCCGSNIKSVIKISQLSHDNVWRKCTWALNVFWTRCLVLSVWHGKCSATCSQGTVIKRCNFYVYFNNQVGTSRYEYEMTGINDLGKRGEFLMIFTIRRLIWKKRCNWVHGSTDGTLEE